MASNAATMTVAAEKKVATGALNEKVTARTY